MMNELDEIVQSISENASDITAGMESRLENVEMIASSVDQITE